ncbi:DUF362 domain-containing protein [Salinigranum rubrum]|uniref:DUF362 domain-containing protein n=1 Tax=Salinigranum rubrum TaxID=755307 RepID=A0A2I8VEK1_9EURY|nr:DUF362 domain-containing protein [Salinigranum rubrum]AUV80346.1 DUF362 domain-containing protein [Salinigranum rubrum]
MLELPDADRLAALSDATPADLPDVALLEHVRDHPQVDDVAAATRTALDEIPALAALSEGATVGLTAGSRGIHDMPTVLRTTVEYLDARGLEPFVFPAMGSHGGATAEGQREALAALGVTEETMGCEVRSSMAVERVADDSEGRPIFAASDALAADAVLLLNRVKAHTDFRGRYESGLAKMAVIGLGKQRGAEITHNVGLVEGLDEVIPERAAALFEETPVVGGVAIVENADDRAAHVEGVPVDEILDREPDLLARSKELLPMLPTSNLDLLVIDEIGKEISGTGMDTNVVGRVCYHNQPEPEEPSYTRIYVRGVTEASHGNGIGIGLADFVHADLVADLDLTETYVNVITSGEVSRARIPLIAERDDVALRVATSTTGVRDPAALRFVRVPNTLDLGRFVASAPVVEELADRDDVRVLERRPFELVDGDLPPDPYATDDERSR